MQFVLSSAPWRLFAGHFKPVEVGELFYAVAGGHGDVSEALGVELFGDIFAFYAFAQFGIYI